MLCSQGLGSVDLAAKLNYVCKGKSMCLQESLNIVMILGVHMPVGEGEKTLDHK